MRMSGVDDHAVVRVALDHELQRPPTWHDEAQPTAHESPTRHPDNDGGGDNDGRRAGVSRLVVSSSGAAAGIGAGT
jgi:hypothetical protein